MGLGVFSGGVEPARYFAERGHAVTVTDLGDEDRLQTSINALRDLPVRLVLGEHREADFTETDLLVVSPAVKDSNSYLELARRRGVALTTEINLVFEQCPAPILGITGSNGKTTTTRLLGDMLQNHDPASLVGGNIGKSVLNEIGSLPSESLAVLELSSFQLHRLTWIGASPHISIVTNLSPNHLDWHATFEAYVTAKRKILEYQTEGDFAILNADDPLLSDWDTHTRGRAIWFGMNIGDRLGAFVKDGVIVYRSNGSEREVVSLADLFVPGSHNVSNALAAVTGAVVANVPIHCIQKAIRGFRGVAHRLEYVTDHDGVRFYNDSACTTPDSSLTALKAFDEPIVLIAGGYDKGIPFDELARECVQSARAVVLIGDTAAELNRAITTVDSGRGPEVVCCSSMEDAVATSQILAHSGDVVLLSPACASYDMFENFEARGSAFKAAVGKLKCSV